MKHTADLKLHVETLPFINLSLYLNDVSFIQSLVLANTGEADAGAIELRISSHMPCFEPLSRIFSLLLAGKEVKVPLAGLAINRAFLTSIMEIERAKVRSELVVSDQLIEITERMLFVYQAEYFGRFGILPNLIAAYVIPNHSFVYHVKREEVEVLDGRGCARVFGFAKVGRQIDELVRYAEDMAEREGKIKSENGRVKWVG